MNIKKTNDSKQKQKKGGKEKHTGCGGTVLSREWSVVLDLLLLLDNEITREMHDHHF